MPSGGPVHATSNNIFSDMVYELGYFGLTCYIALFFKMIKKAYDGIYQNRNCYVAFLFSVHLLISSMYRADFMQPRFWIIMFLILKIIQIEDKNENTVQRIRSIY